ncbi:hypothetical protein L7F22_041889 [Adiantum nelumboides]|nr:hypothetical protein [Adiantum nelumboides]
MLLISSIIPPDEETEFFSMPSDVRQHFLKGKRLKIEVGKDRLPVKVFVREEGALTTSETVFLCHGLGASSFAYRSLISSLASCGLHVIALDFPGAGLSEKPAGNQGGLFLKLREIFKEIREKGLLWRFEQMFERGAFPDPTPTFGVDVHYDAVDLSESIDQVVSLLAPSPVHVVLHDTSVEAGLTWAIRKPTLVRSITLIDAYPGTPSFPAGLLGFPGLGSLVLRSSVLLQALLRLCCVTHVTHVEANSHAFLLRIYGGQGAALQAWQKANSSFDLISSIEKLSELPVHLLWSNSSGTHWQELGDSLASRLPLASYASHNGGRWPQEDKAPELTEDIYGFITSLPPTLPSSAADSIPRNTEEMLTAKKDDAVNYGHSGHICDHGHNHDHGHLHEGHHVDHVHDHGLGYMEHMPHGGWVI